MKICYTFIPPGGNYPTLKNNTSSNSGNHKHDEYLTKEEFEKIKDELQGVVGASGREIELQKGEDYIQWRYVGEEEWTNLIAIEEITADGTTVKEVITIKSEIEQLQDKLESTYIEWEDGLFRLSRE
jgi:hypothetical protein